jgi:hypothetical protein
MKVGGIQKADGDEQRADDQDRNPHLRLSNTVIFCSIVAIDLIREPCGKHSGSNEADPEPEISETGGSDAETVGMGEELW